MTPKKKGGARYGLPLFCLGPSISPRRGERRTLVETLPINSEETSGSKRPQKSNPG